MTPMGRQMQVMVLFDFYVKWYLVWATQNPFSLCKSLILQHLLTVFEPFTMFLWTLMFPLKVLHVLINQSFSCLELLPTVFCRLEILKVLYPDWGLPDKATHGCPPLEYINVCVESYRYLLEFTFCRSFRPCGQ